MAVPATSGQLRTDLQDMKIGDYIACKYVAASGAAGEFSDLGGTVDTEIPVTGTATPNGYFYFIKVDKGLLVADRVVQHSISWYVLNAAGYIEGRDIPEFENPKLTSADKAFASSESSGCPAWKAFDGVVDDASLWVASATTIAHLGYIFNVPTKVNEYSLTCWTGYSSGPSRQPKDWTFEGWDGDNWVVLDTQTNITSWVLGGTKTFILNAGAVDSYIKYRINITASNGGTDVGTGEFRLYFKGVEKLIRSLSGGIAYIDADGNPVTTAPSPQLGGWPADNEYDKYIVNSDLGGKIIPGDDFVWNWSQKQIWFKETSISGVNYRVITNLNDKLTGRNLTYTFSSAHVNLGFRPVLEYIDESLRPKNRPTTLWY